MKFVRSAVVVAAAAVALVPTAAQAAGSSHSDAVGDQHSVAVDSAGHVTDTTSTPEPASTNGDITSIHVVNGSRVVKVVTRYRDLAATGRGLLHELQILSPNRNRLVYIDAYPGRWGGKATMRTAHGKRVSCAVRHRIDYARNVIVVKVPRSCLGRPRVVKVGAATLVGDGAGKIFYDDAYRVGGEWTDTFVLSPKVFR